jgi:uncharacterized damage-inducible protein DinB
MSESVKRPDELRAIDVFPDLQGVRESLLKRVRNLTSEQLAWRVTPTSFSVAEIIRHIAWSDDMAVFEVLGEPYSKHTERTHPTLASMLEDLAKQYDRKIKMLKELTLIDLQRKFTTSDGEETTIWRFLFRHTDHEIHHRGQLSVYLKLMAQEAEREGKDWSNLYKPVYRSGQPLSYSICQLKSSKRGRAKEGV